jgi:uncharacterized protein YlxP (DUF503 family)
MPLGLLTLQIYIPGCQSLKEKRSRLKPLLTRLHKEFNVSVAEMDHLDSWQSAIIACAMVNNDAGQISRSLQHISRWLEKNWPDIDIEDERIELV